MIQQMLQPKVVVFIVATEFFGRNDDDIIDNGVFKNRISTKE